MNSITLQSMLAAAGEVAEIKQELQNEILVRKAAEAEVDNLKNQLIHFQNTEVFVIILFLHI